MKYLPILVTLTILLQACASQQPAHNYPRPQPAMIESQTTTTPQNTTPDALLATARSQIGSPYRNGGLDPTGYDCSGLVWWVYHQNGIDLPRETDAQIQAGHEIPPSQAQPGDLVFFDISGKRKNLHVGIYNGDGGFIHSPRSGFTVREESMQKDYWRSRFIETRRIVE